MLVSKTRRQMKHQRIRARLLFRWAVLLEQLDRLEREVASATDSGVFESDERAVVTLNQAWHTLAARPTFLVPKG